MGRYPCPAPEGRRLTKRCSGGVCLKRAFTSADSAKVERAHPNAAENIYLKPAPRYLEVLAGVVAVFLASGLLALGAAGR